MEPLPDPIIVRGIKFNRRTHYQDRVKLPHFSSQFKVGDIVSHDLRPCPFSCGGYRGPLIVLGFVANKNSSDTRKSGHVSLVLKNIRTKETTYAFLFKDKHKYRHEYIVHGHCNIHYWSLNRCSRILPIPLWGWTFERQLWIANKKPLPWWTLLRENKNKTTLWFYLPEELVRYIVNIIYEIYKE